MDGNRTFPVGTAIKYIGYCAKCNNKLGKVVKVQGDTCFIVLPQSICSSFSKRDSLPVPWSDIEPAIKVGEQLLFSFMETYLG